ncbi:MAG: hypothetical protein LBG58_08470 [Planctomycetaceae bacterium]|nr:hypothetical protein [Planctomycetaceae bacterium]
MFRRNIFTKYTNTEIADLPLCADGNEKTRATVATVGENPSPKDFHPQSQRLPTS